jgi:hypothetical protein
VKTGDGKTPKQYEVAIAKAKEAGLPCVVVEYASGAAVVVSPTPDAVRKAVKP